jgi:hypothetical protein
VARHARRNTAKGGLTGMNANCRDAPASFETRAAPAPQDEVIFLMALKKILILRSGPAQAGARLEGRTASIQHLAGRLV